MTFDEYQKQSKKTAIYPKIGLPIVYPALGLSGETGELVEKIKKIFRDHSGKITSEYKQEIVKEAGDVLWYLAQICTEMDVSLSDVAQTNLQKLSSRSSRGQLHGAGDNR